MPKRGKQIRQKPPNKGIAIKIAARGVYEDKQEKRRLLNHINVDKAVDRILKDIGVTI